MCLQINAAANAGVGSYQLQASDSSSFAQASTGSFGKEISLLRCCQCLKLLLGAVKHVLRFAICLILDTLSGLFCCLLCVY